MTTCGHCKTQRVSVEHVKMCSRLGTEGLAKAASALGLSVTTSDRSWATASGEQIVADIKTYAAPTLDRLSAEEVKGFYSRMVFGQRIFYRVKVSRTSGRAYAEEWDGWRWDYLGARALRDLTLADRLTAEQAKAWSNVTHACIFCGLDLTDDRSTDAGYGPVCAEKNGLPWGD